MVPSGIADCDGDRVFDPAQRLFRLADGRQIPSAGKVGGGFRCPVDTACRTGSGHVSRPVAFNIALFVFGFVVLSLQPIAPLNPRGQGMLEPTTIFNTVISFMTNTNSAALFATTSRISARRSSSCRICSSASVDSALAAIIRAFRGEGDARQFLRRYGASRTSMPVAPTSALAFMQQGMPMTFNSTEVATTLESRLHAVSTTRAGQTSDVIVVGPVAAVSSDQDAGHQWRRIHGMNLPIRWRTRPRPPRTFSPRRAMMPFPFAPVLMYGRVGRIRHSRHPVVWCWR